MRLLLLLCMLLMVGARALAADAPVLRIATFSSYIPIDPTAPGELPTAERSPVLRAFMQAHGCRLEYREFDAIEELRAHIATDRASIDVVCTSPWAWDGSPYADPLPDAAQLDWGAWSEVGPLRQALTGIVPSPCRALPWAAGSIGLLRRIDRVAQPPATWTEVFAMPRLGAIALPGSLYAAALVASGGDLTKATAPDARPAWALLRSWIAEGRVTVLSADPAALAAALHDGSIDSAITYLGEGQAAARADPRLGWSIPGPQAELFIDGYAVIAEDPVRRSLGQAFIRHLLHPDTQRQVASAMNYLPVTANGVIDGRLPAGVRLVRTPALAGRATELRWEMLLRGLGR